MILRLVVALDALDSERREILAQPRERPLVQEAGEIVRRVRQQFAAPEPDEQIEVFALDPLRRSLRRGFGERDMRDAERRRIAAQCATASSAARRPARAPARSRAARIPARVRYRSRRLGGIGARDRDRAADALRSTPVAASTASTRSAGTLSQLETDGCEMPTRRASSETPPAAWIASLKPGSRIKSSKLMSPPPHEKRSKRLDPAQSVVNSWAIV